jgi:outer membrane biosynthesis protein TonB
VALGLLSQVSEQFEWGPALATAVTAEVLVNQLVGPLLFKAPNPSPKPTPRPSPNPKPKPSLTPKPNPKPKPKPKLF